ncbi:hypothetical protein [Clostridium sp.]
MIEMPDLYKAILGNKEIENIFEWTFDFKLISPSTDTSQYSFKTEQQVVCIAGDASGGIFALWGDGEVDEKAVIYVSSEGQAGKIASNFQCLISLIVFYPFWRDILKFSGEGQISEMEKALHLLIKEYLKEIPELEKLKTHIGSSLSICETDDAVKRLYYAVTAQPNIIVTSSEGDVYQSLFNSFVVSDNPLWR